MLHVAIFLHLYTVADSVLDELIHVSFLRTRDILSESLIETPDHANLGELHLIVVPPVTLHRQGFGAGAFRPRPAMLLKQFVEE